MPSTITRLYSFAHICVQGSHPSNRFPTLVLVVRSASLGARSRYVKISDIFYHKGCIQGFGIAVFIIHQVVTAHKAYILQSDVFPGFSDLESKYNSARIFQPHGILTRDRESLSYYKGCIQGLEVWASIEQ